MTTALHIWADAGVGGLIEAPTGTGKSYAILAAALDWLAGAPDRTAIITTCTKQLQAQLAHDVATSTPPYPGCSAPPMSSRARANRLSLRALMRRARRRDRAARRVAAHRRRATATGS